MTDLFGEGEGAPVFDTFGFPYTDIYRFLQEASSSSSGPSVGEYSNAWVRYYNNQCL